MWIIQRLYMFVAKSKNFGAQVSVMEFELCQYKLDLGDYNNYFIRL